MVQSWLLENVLHARSMKSVDAKVSVEAGTTADSPPCSRHVPWTERFLPSPTHIPKLDAPEPLVSEFLLRPLDLDPAVKEQLQVNGFCSNDEVF